MQTGSPPELADSPPAYACDLGTSPLTCRREQTAYQLSRAACLRISNTQDAIAAHDCIANLAADCWLALQEDSCPDYMQKAEDCLRAEEGRVAAYLHINSKTKLMNKVRTWLSAFCILSRGSWEPTGDAPAGEGALWLRCPAAG